MLYLAISQWARTTTKLGVCVAFLSVAYARARTKSIQ